MSYLLKLSYFLLTLLPLAVYYFFADCIFILIYYFLRYRRNVVKKNISRAFPSKTPENKKSIEKKFYRHLADYMVESAAMVRMTKSDYATRFRFVNIDLFDSALKQGKNVLLASGHYGNWEWICCLPLFSKNTVYAVYKEQSNRFINAAMLYAREKNGMRLLSYPRVYKEILALPQGNSVAVYMLTDQRPKMENKAHWIEFMNQQITYFRGLENLNKAMQGAVFYAQILKTKRGHYTIEFIPLEPRPLEDTSGEWLTKRYFKALEENIRIDPAFYLWSHNRWKFIRPGPEVN